MTGTVPPVPPVKEKRLLSVTVPPDRSTELKEIEKEIERIEMELEKVKKVNKKQKMRRGIEPMRENGVIWKS